MLSRNQAPRKAWAFRFFHSIEECSGAIHIALRDDSDSEEGDLIPGDERHGGVEEVLEKFLDVESAVEADIRGASDVGKDQ